MSPGWAGDKEEQVTSDTGFLRGTKLRPQGILSDFENSCAKLVIFLQFECRFLQLNPSVGGSLVSSIVRPFS